MLLGVEARGGTPLFNFGNGNTLRVENVSSLSALSDDLGIV